MGDVSWRCLVGGGVVDVRLLACCEGWWTSFEKVSMDMSPRESVGVLLHCGGGLVLSSRTSD